MEIAALSNFNNGKIEKCFLTTAQHATQLWHMIKLFLAMLEWFEWSIFIWYPWQHKEVDFFFAHRSRKSSNCDLLSINLSFFLQKKIMQSNAERVNPYVSIKSTADAWNAWFMMKSCFCCWKSRVCAETQ